MSLIKLGISLDYPIYWDNHKIMRDLIQNFYDAIGMENFASNFTIEQKDNESGSIFYKDLVMSSMNTPFSYEWLCSIGGSTKTDVPGSYIGMYGEGFKMCALCLLKSDRIIIKMESMNWKITSCIYTENVDNQIISMLGYELENRIDDNYTRLTIKKTPVEYYEIAQKTMLEFFYPENPLFGKQLYKDDKIIIFSRSDEPIPCENKPKDFLGILFCNYLARGRLPIPLNILIKTDFTKIEHRKRDDLSDCECKDLLLCIIKSTTPEASMIILEYMKPFWNDMPKRIVDSETCYYIICNLVRNIVSKEETKKKFKKKYKNLHFVDRKNNNSSHNLIVEQTQRYVKSLKIECVNPIFRLLGAKSMVKELNNQKLKQFKTLNPEQKEKINMLLKLCEIIIGKKIYKTKPRFYIQSQEFHLDPLVFSTNIYKSKTHQRYCINKIILNEEDFQNDSFNKTFIKLMDTLLHSYGATGSNALNLKLTSLGSKIYIYRNLITRVKEIWNARKQHDE